MTKDHDRKKLVRARMGTTGEPYTTARERLFGTRPRDTYRAGAVVTADELRVWFGEPTAFAVSIPISTITDAVRLPDRTGEPIGVHGAAGRFVVITADADADADAGLVRVACDPPATAVAEPHGALEAASALGRLLVDTIAGVPVGPIVLSTPARNRMVRLRELTFSVADPERILAELRRSAPGR
jgi:hypothetical protein